MPTAFRPSTHGFRFANCFPSGTPVITVPTPFGRIPIGNAAGGLCGGMVYAALDAFFSGTPVPQADAAGPELIARLGRRLIESWDLPFGVLRYYDWQRRRLADRTFAGVTVEAGLTSLTLLEWPKLRTALDAGRPVPLGLVNADSLSPRAAAENHQVLAWGYEWDEPSGDLTVNVYDPNHPLRDDLALRWTTAADPAVGLAVRHTNEKRPVRGFFVSEYRRLLDPPAFL